MNTNIINNNTSSTSDDDLINIDDISINDTTSDEDSDSDTDVNNIDIFKDTIKDKIDDANTLEALDGLLNMLEFQKNLTPCMCITSDASELLYKISCKKIKLQEERINHLKTIVAAELDERLINITSFL